MLEELPGHASPLGLDLFIASPRDFKDDGSGSPCAASKGRVRAPAEAHQRGQRGAIGSSSCEDESPVIMRVGWVCLLDGSIRITRSHLVDEPHQRFERLGLAVSLHLYGHTRQERARVSVVTSV